MAFFMLNGCSSQKNFVRPSQGMIQLGKSTTADLIQAVGEPKFRRKDIPLNNEKVESLDYVYGDSPKFWGVIIHRHTLNYTSFNDVIIGEEFNSTYEEESTEFKAENIPQIKKGVSTEADVIAIMGKPSGRAIYPLVKDKDSTAIIYTYSYARFAGAFTSFNNSMLFVTLDSKGVVSDISYKKDGKEQDSTPKKNANNSFSTF